MAEIDVDQVKRLSHTQDFDVPEFIVTRRDTSFPITLRTRSGLTVQSVTLDYEEGKKINLEVEDTSSRVYATIVTVHIPAKTPVTLYTLNVTGQFEDGEDFSVALKQQVVVLFNTWSTNDPVYMEDEQLRREYVLNHRGKLYIGDLYGTPWNLALYRPDCLRAVLFLLENKSKLTFEQKRDPIQVAQEMSALVNVQDEYGVVVGRWDGVYDDGKNPSFWRGSGEILQQYYKTGGEPVKYGQCWVFSGVLLTVLRILGIPSRSVTNFNSAHDTNRNRTIDEYYDENNQKVRYLNTGGDSIWNFHVWNETWMTRPDLPPGFDGWQAVDATPQEESPQGGGYRTGPASLKAIKEGNSVPFDTNFIIAEVNADIKKYKLENGVPKLFEVDQTTVGKYLSTKAVGSYRREDLTNSYKYPEGSEREREALYHGHEELLKETHDVTFEIPRPEYQFGQNVEFEVKMTNKARQHRILGKILCEAITYTGRVLREVKSQDVDIKVNKGKTESIQVAVSGEVFSEYPGTKVYLRFDVILSVTGTSQIFAEKVPVAPTPPELKIVGPDRIAIGQEATMTAVFKNPLPVKMSDITLNIESDELLSEDIVQNIGSIGPEAEFTYSFTVTGLKLGSHDLVVGMESDKVELVTGQKEIEVVKVLPSDAPAPPIVSLDAVDIQSIELNLSANRSAHHTASYDYRGLVVRRGQKFNITLNSSKPLAGSMVTARAVFQLQSNRIYTSHAFEVETISKTEGTAIHLELKPPADVAIGEYELLLAVESGGRVTVVHRNIKLIILFNPWSSEDGCYYTNASDLSEYVLNNAGQIWVGNDRSNWGRPWQFGQFTKDSLEVALWIVDRMPVGDRGNPIEVSRNASAYVNIQDDNGVLVGNWSGDYSGGKSPLEWSGSAEILSQFNRSKQPVRYAQCWVFSGVLTTVLRSLGLPARSVTNFNSAHDTNFNRAIDKYYDENGDYISTGDSIWNFHVWNDVWMARPDLPSGFGGWQAVDATPQEESPQGGGYRTGPASLQAVKLGQRFNYDVEFVISEVNADVRTYVVNTDKSLTLVDVNTTHVGKKMSTKAIGSADRQDVTDQYKFEEGSSSERAALLAGKSESSKALGLELTLDDSVRIGDDFSAKVTVTNKSSATKELKVSINARIMSYTGAVGQLVKGLQKFHIFSGGETKNIDLDIDDVDYLRILEGGNFIHFVAIVYDAADKLSVVKTANYRLRTPDVIVKVPEGGLKLYQPATIQVSFTNPLRTTLTGGKFVLHGEGFVQDATLEIPRVPSKGVAFAELSTIPVKQGQVGLVVTFASDQLIDVIGIVNTQVQ